MPKLTKRTIDATEPQATEFFLWDEGIPGFGLRVMPSGFNQRFQICKQQWHSHCTGMTMKPSARTPGGTGPRNLPECAPMKR